MECSIHRIAQLDEIQNWVRSRNSDMTRCLLARSLALLLLAGGQQALNISAGGETPQQQRAHRREKHERARRYHHHPMMIRKASLEQQQLSNGPRRIIRTAVLAVGMLRGLKEGQLEMFGLIKFLQYLKCKGVSSNCSDTATTATTSTPPLSSPSQFLPLIAEIITSIMLSSLSSSS